MFQQFKNKNCLITGGTQSIGKAIAQQLLEQGANVWITGRRSQQKGDEIANSLHPNCNYLPLSVEKYEDWQQAKQYFKNNHVSLDILVNNAGIEYPVNADPSLQNPENCALSDWQKVFAVNVDGVFLGCQFALTQMKNNGGTIINIGSRSALVGVPASAAYAASKAAITNLTKSVALYAANNQYPIRCNVIHPAAIDSAMWDKELGTDENRNYRKQIIANNIPMGKMGEPADIANAVLFFASDLSSFITGTELVIDGGIMLNSTTAAKASMIELL